MRHIYTCILTADLFIAEKMKTIYGPLNEVLPCKITNLSFNVFFKYVSQSYESR